MYTCGYTPMHGHLVLQRFDRGLVSLGVSLLEAQTKSTAYMASKERSDFERAIRASEGEAKEIAEARRASFAALVPPEPPEGEGGSSKLCFHLSPAGRSEEVKTVAPAPTMRTMEGVKVSTQPKVTDAQWRRFESWRTVEDLYNYVRSIERGVSPEVVLVKCSPRPEIVLDEDEFRTKSLESLGLWPSGHLRIVSKA